MHKLYYTEPSGFSEDIDGLRIQPLMYQPTPEGLTLLCRFYSEKYTIDLQGIDLERHEELTSGDNILNSFMCFKRHYLGLLELKEGQSRGIILCYRQHHVIPVLLTYQDKTLYIMVFDSTSGARIKGYFSIASLFPNAIFFLNTGTRQADSSSCFTDAVCILKEALQITDLVSLIKSKVDTTHRCLVTNPNSRFQSSPKPDHFYLFRMPEKLLCTAQRSEYIKDAQADLNVVLRDGHTLDYHRKRCCINVSMSGSPQKEVRINSYLFEKAKEHKQTLDYLSKKSNASSFRSIAFDTEQHPAFRTLTSPAAIHSKENPFSSRMLLDILAKTTAPAGLLAAISLYTKHYSIGLISSGVALAGFFIKRHLSSTQFKPNSYELTQSSASTL